MPGDPEESLRYARRAVRLEDDPSRWGWVVARQALARALHGVGHLAEQVAVLDEVWKAPVRRQLPTLFTLQVAGDRSHLTPPHHDTSLGPSRQARSTHRIGRGQHGA